jgi:phosphoglycerate dehydrogenase-like enzyme
MNIILPVQIRELIEPRIPEGITVAWAGPDGIVEGDPTTALAYFRWWTSRPVLEQILALAPEVRWVHTPSAGVEHLLIPAILEREITLTNSAGVHAIPIAEFVFGFMLAKAKKLATYRAAQAEARWARDLQLEELYGATLLILGIGGIGQAIAERASAFGMRILGSRRTPRPLAGVEQVVGEDGWRALVPEADYLVVATPLTPTTQGMIDSAVFAAMKPSAYLINIARGAVIDEPALLQALHGGRIAGAALDTFEEEPLPAESPLWHAPGVTITPHATSNSPRMRLRQIDLFLENLARFRKGEALMNVVDKDRGY